jgi:hypothetical protein
VLNDSTTETETGDGTSNSPPSSSRTRVLVGG